MKFKVVVDGERVAVSGNKIEGIETINIQVSDVNIGVISVDKLSGFGKLIEEYLTNKEEPKEVVNITLGDEGMVVNDEMLKAIDNIITKQLKHLEELNRGRDRRLRY